MFAGRPTGKHTTMSCHTGLSSSIFVLMIPAKENAACRPASKCSMAFSHPVSASVRFAEPRPELVEGCHGPERCRLLEKDSTPPRALRRGRSAYRRWRGRGAARAARKIGCKALQRLNLRPANATSPALRGDFCQPCLSRSPDVLWSRMPPPPAGRAPGKSAATL